MADLLEREDDDVAHDDWAKMDARLDSNPKIRRGGRNARDVFLFLLRRNRLLRGGGRLPVANIERWYLADQLMISEPDADEGVTRAVSAGLISIDADVVVICGFDDDWGGRAPLSDAERSKRYRERHGASRENRDASRDGRDESDASRRREEKRGEEKRVPSRKTAMPDGFAPNENHAAKAVQLGVALAHEFEAFVDHHTANGSRFSDWNAALNTWLRNAARFAQQRRPVNGNGAVVPFRARTKL